MVLGMRTVRLVASIWGLVLALGSGASVEARVTRFVVERTTPYADGRAFGDAGAFERPHSTCTTVSAIRCRYRTTCGSTAWRVTLMLAPAV